MVKPHRASGGRSDVDWRHIVLDDSQQGLLLIESLARRRFNVGPLAEEASTYILEKLSDNDWQRCSQFEGKAKARTFLQTLITNLLEEFSRKKFGRPRPPSWLKRQGDLWVKLWRELCLERQPVQALLIRYESGGLFDGDLIAQTAKVIKARIPRCGEYRFEAMSVGETEQLDALSNQDDTVATPPDLCGYDIELDAQTEILTMIKALMQDQPDPEAFASRADSAPVAEVAPSRVDEFRKAIALSDEEVVMLRMSFCDGLSKTAVSRALGLAPHQAGLVINQAISRIRAAASASGLDLESLLNRI